MFNGRTTLRTAVVALAVAAMIAPACAAHADPTPEQLQAQIDKGNNEVELVVEQYNKVKGDLEATEAAIAKLQADLAPLQVTMNAPRTTPRRSRSTPTRPAATSARWSLMLGASSSDAFYRPRRHAQQISRSQQRDLAAYSAAKDAVAAEQRRLNETQAAQSQQKIDLETRRKKIEGDIARLGRHAGQGRGRRRGCAAAAKTKPTTTTTAATPANRRRSPAPAGKAVSYAWASSGRNTCGAPPGRTPSTAPG